MVAYTKYLLPLLIAVPGVLAAQSPDVSGTWQADSDASLKWTFDQKSGTIHVQERMGEKVEADFTCPLSGQECEVKEGGRSAKIMMYFNGDKLVKITEHGNTSEKQRFAVSPDGKTLSLETIPLSSEQKAEKLSFHRQSS
jgi:hypothetical protein